jgi:hypothetical protein
MIIRSRTALISLLVAVASVLTVPSAAGAVVVGISDQTAGMFSDPHFTSLNLQTARIVVSWDVMDRGHQRELSAVTAWLAAAARDQVSPLVSIGPDSLNGNNVPSIRRYSSSVQRFIARFPAVRTYTAWNEPDWRYRTAVARHPALAAGYFNWLSVHCHRCSVVAGDFSDSPASELRPYVRAYARYLHHRPAAWAVHNYLDIRSHTTSVLRMMLQLTQEPIWLTEVGGVERRGHWPYGNQSAIAAGRDEAFLFALPRRFPRIARIYHYQWRDYPSAHWDSGLLGPRGELRAAYGVVARVLR